MSVHLSELQRCVPLTPLTTPCARKDSHHALFAQLAFDLNRHRDRNSLVKPFLTVISLPLTIITLGIFQLVVNSFMLELASYLSVNLLGAGISIAGFGSAFMGSILVSIMRSILDGVARN